LVAPQPESEKIDVVPWRVLLVASVAAAAFLFLPGDLSHKAHLVLQGVCAQRPSHSFQFSGQPLPVDARMTGIYLGAASSLVWYLVLCRARHSGRFTRAAWIVLALCIGAMALDGLNALGMDLSLSTPYASTNLTRVTTGLLSGVAIGALLSHLATISLTHRPRGGWPVASVSTLAPPLAVGTFLCATAATGLPTLALPTTCLIAASTIVVLWAMTSVLVALVLRRGWGFESARQRDETLAMALGAACILLVGLAAWRSVLEHLMGPIRLS
jgi:uncharacterized membrane protein